MPNNPSLLDDIEAEYHAHLLTSGNLPAAKKAIKAIPSTPLALVINWKFSEHVAMLEVTTCTHCGGVQKSLTGLFQEDLGPQGSRRWKNLTKDPSFNPHTSKFRVDTTPVSAAICPDCLPSS